MIALGGSSRILDSTKNNAQKCNLAICNDLLPLQHCN